jgi:DNA modification methylase
MTLTTTDRTIIEYLKSLYEKSHGEWDGPLVLSELEGTVHNLDASEYLRLFPDNSVKLILTDEPYGQANTRLNLKARSDITTDFEWGHVPELPDIYNGLVYEDKIGARLPTHLYTEWVFEAARVLEEHGILINFGMSEFTGTMRDICVHAGLMWRASGPWIKTNPAPHFRKNNFRSGHETFFVASKGTTKGFINFQEQQEMINWLIDTRCPNCNAEFPVTFSNNYNFPEWSKSVENWNPVWETSNLTNKKSRHQTEKPDWLLTKFITIFSNPGDMVIDPFGGSGSTSVAAKRLGRKWSTNDMTPEWYEYIKQRMSSQVNSFIS